MKLNVYLLREDVQLEDDIFRASANIVDLASTGPAASDTRAVVVSSREKPPGWAQELQALFDMNSHVTAQRSFGAVVLIARHSRVFAVTFGIGYQILESVYLEQGFGLRVAANMIATSRIRGAQTRGIATNARDQRTILPKDGEFGDLDIEVDDDWMRQINGRSADGSFASSLVGGDSLRLTVPNFGLSAIRAKIDQIWAARNKDEYKVKFPFLDQMQPLGLGDVRLPRLQKCLKELMAQSDVAYSAPDPFTKDEEAFHHYELIIRRSRWEFADLEHAEILNLLQMQFKDGDWLNEVKVAAVDADGDLVDRLRTLGSYVTAEVQLGAERFFVTAGHWFVIGPDFVQRVERAVARIPDVTGELNLPVWNVADLQSRATGNHREEVYNSDLSSSRGWALLDKRLVHYGRHDKIEAADILTSSGHLLCIKSASNSPALSHLVAQATVSASMWGSEPHEQMLKKALEEMGLPSSGALRREDATFVLAIATDRAGPLHESLFFFTKVLLANALSSITSASLKIAIARIEMDVPTPVKKVRTRKTPRAVQFED